MTIRVFISYRASDGADKATALARDLDARFGNDQVFLDKDDLPAGSRWRDAIAGALHECPILLVLVTPNYLGAVDTEGHRCIDRDDDPARDELQAGIAAKAHVIPLLCDGVDSMPAAEALPKPFDLLTELQWGRLRAYDWREDTGRLADDLRRLGVSPSGTATAAWSAEPVTTPVLDAGGGSAVEGRGSAPPDRRLLLGAAALALLGLGSWGYWRWRRQRAANLSGRWSAHIGARGALSSRDGALVLVTLQQIGRRLTLASSAVDIEHDPAWENYRDFWRQRNGAELKQVYYRGEGKVLGDDEEDDESDDPNAPTRARAPPPHGAAAARRIAVAMHIFAPGAASEALDGGGLRGTVDIDGQRIQGRLWLNSEQAERIVDLKRGG